MTKELSTLIEDINKIKKMDDMMGIGDFLDRFKKGVSEEPEKIGDLMKAYDILMKKSFPYMPVNKRWALTLKGIVRYCFLADKNYYEIDIDTLLSLGEPLIDYLMDSEEYGPATKALSDYLKCDNETLVIKIFKPSSLN